MLKAKRSSNGDGKRIADPRRRTVTVNYFKGNIVSVQYPFDSTIKVNIYDDLLINFSEIADLLSV